MIAHDIYAETNPAFCALILAWLASGYLEPSDRALEVPAAYIAVPLILSEQFAPAFDGTNKRTGLLAWIDRNPGVLVGIADRINATSELVTDAIRYGALSETLRLGTDGCLAPGPKNLWGARKVLADDYVADACKRADRLGYWFAGVGPTRAIFTALGLTV